jgi:hypothetical protein
VKAEEGREAMMRRLRGSDREVESCSDTDACLTPMSPLGIVSAMMLVSV